MYALAVEILKLLATPQGALSLVAALLAGGIAIREYRAVKRNGNGHGPLKLADGPGDHTAELARDLDALSHDACATDEALAVVRADVQRVDKLVTGSPGGMQERLAIVENICLETKDAVEALPETLVRQLAALFAEKSKAEREQLVRETSVASAKVVYRILRREGVLEDRRKGPPQSMSPHLERRKAGGPI